MKLSGAKILLKCLQLEGVGKIFGYPGGAVLDIFDQLFDSPIDLILVRHEQAAVHAADGFARTTGKVGVCLVTSGPGATNTVTGIATAYMDSIPLLIFTGQVPTKLIGNDAFQEADMVGITRPCTKHNYLIKDVNSLSKCIKEAFYIARTGRPGPVLIDLPKDVMKELTSFTYPDKVELKSYQPTYQGHRGQIKKMADLLLKSKKPVIYAGGGIISSGASSQLLRLAEMLSIPVTTSLMGIGGFPGPHPLNLGMLGMHGTFRANMAITGCDLLITLGARFADRDTGKIDGFAPHSKIIHVDIDPTSISKNVQVDIPIVGDVKLVLQELINILEKEEKTGRESHSKEWLTQISEWKKTHPLAYSQKDRIKPQYVVEKIYEMTGGDAIISTEVGQNQMWASQYYLFKEPRTFLTSGGLGTMGYGFPAAIGAQVAFPDKTVIDIAGDGSIQMNIQELATAVQYNLPVKIAILNNGYLGMVRQWQELFYQKRYSHTCMDVAPDFVKLADAYGILGLRATKPDEVVPVIEEALSSPKPVIMDFVVEKEEGVYPMVPAGKPINQMLLV